MKAHLFNRRSFLVVGSAAVSARAIGSPLVQQRRDKKATTRVLDRDHIAAIRRTRRIVFNYDVISGDRSFGGRDPDELARWKLTPIDLSGSQIDSVWWGWGEGHQAPWPSRTMPLYDQPGYQKWVDEGVDIVQVFLQASRKRGIEAFYNYRINGSDNDLGPVRKIPMKEKHPDWLIHTWNENGYWNFAVEGVREYKLGILREIAGRYVFDGIALDFARVCPVLPPGHQWELRDHLTRFLRQLREMTLEVARKRNRPLLLAARVPENLEGCHFDGLDVETWSREELIDLFALGVRSFDVDLAAFRRITEGTQIRLYPCIDDHHASDGYQTAPIEIYRGVASNWWFQGADGVQIFNFNHAPDFPYGQEVWDNHSRVYREIGSRETLRGKNKTFVVQRRGGGHGPSVIPNPEDWTTPRLMYFNTNMLAPLPADLDNDGKADTLLRIHVGDALMDPINPVERITLRLLLSDPWARHLPMSGRLKTVTIATIGHPGPLRNLPLAKGTEHQLEVRLNNILLGGCSTEDGWITWQLRPELLAVGSNLLGIRVRGRPEGVRERMFVEKAELNVQHRA